MRIWLLGVVLLIGLALGPAGASALGTPDAVATKAAVPPVIDGSANDPVWVATTPLMFGTTENENSSVPRANVSVTMKFAYDANFVYVLAQWPDASWSVLKHAWAFNATAKKWTTSNDEDRFAIMWDHPEFPIESFLPISGCKIACHSAKDAPPGSEVALADEKFLSTNAANEKGDLWHWKAARTAATGWADDQGLTYNFSGKLEVARPSDAKKSGGPSDNAQKINNLSVPKYFEPVALGEKDAAFILKSEVDSGKAVLIHWVDEAGVLYYMTGSTNTTVPANATIPGYVLSRADGSRGDVDAADSWASGTWTLEMRRALNTGDTNDVAFKEGDTYAFAVGVFNNSGGGDHVRSTPYTVKLEPPVVQVTPTPSATPPSPTPSATPPSPTPSAAPPSPAPAASTPPAAPSSGTSAADTPGPGFALMLLALGVGLVVWGQRPK